MSKPDNAPFFVDNEVIVLSKNGVWMADGTEITHEGTRRLFAKSLVRKDDGYYLHVGRETKKIEVEDTAYFVTRIDGSLSNGFELSISNETKEPLNPATLHYQPGRLVCVLKNGETAKFLTNPYMEILNLAHEDADAYHLEIQGQQIELAKKV